jgi:hypothetical protein
MLPHAMPSFKSQALTLIYILFSWPLRTASNDLDSIRQDALIIQLERRVFQDNSPHFVARAVCIQTSLNIRVWSLSEVRKSVP